MKGVYLASLFVAQNPKTLSLQALPMQEGTRAGFKKVCSGYQSGPTCKLGLQGKFKSASCELNASCWLNERLHK